MLQVDPANHKLLASYLVQRQDATQDLLDCQGAARSQEC
jgi:hypothetical protein